MRDTAASGLRGARILLTGTRAERLDALLRESGAAPLAIPTIAVRAADPDLLDRALARAEYAWIVVTSANGARVVADRLELLARGGVPAEDGAHGPRWAAVGPSTARALRAAGIEPMYVPPEGTGAALAHGLGEVAGRRVLLVRARAGTKDLPRILAALGAEVDDVAAYETEEGPASSRQALLAALEEGVDAAVFTSGSAVRGLARLAGDPCAALGGAAVVAIGPTTAAEAVAGGLVPVTARERTPEAIVAALACALEAGRDG